MPTELSEDRMGRKGNKSKNTPENTAQADEAESQACTSNIEGIDDLEDDVREQLPSQEHCTWLLNIIQIHAKKIAKEVLKEHETSVVAQLKQEVYNLKTTNEEMQTKLHECQQEIGKLKRSREGINRELARKTEVIEKLREQLDAVDQKQREARVRLAGISEEEGENLTQKVLKLAKNKLKIKNLKERDIVQIHRSGKQKPSKSRDIIVQFESKVARDQFHGARKKLHDVSNSNSQTYKHVYINDDLTEFRQKLLFDSRMLVKRKKLKGAWSQHGNVMILRENGGPKAIYNYHDLRISSGVETYDYDTGNSDQLEEDDTLDVETASCSTF